MRQGSRDVNTSALFRSRFQHQGVLGHDSHDHKHEHKPHKHKAGSAPGSGPGSKLGTPRVPAIAAANLDQHEKVMDMQGRGGGRAMASVTMLACTEGS